MTFEVDGLTYGTGCVIPPLRVSGFPIYEAEQPVLQMTEIVSAAKSGQFRGKDKFDSSYIQNQKSHGSCNGFALAAALAKARVRRLLPYVRLSGAYAYSLMNGGRDQGSLLEDAFRISTERGVATEATVGWNQIYRSQYDTTKADVEALQYRAFEVYVVNSEVGLMSALIMGFDCVIGVGADDGFMRLDARGVAIGGTSSLNHAVSADGIWYDKELIVDGVNSWDVSYGLEGRMGLTWSRHLRHTNDQTHFYAIRSTLDGSGVPAPPIARV